MFRIGFLTPSPTAVTAGPRRITLLRSGRRHGAITHLITPWDAGELTQPFVFLDYAEVSAGPEALFFGMHRYPGTSTVTVVLNGVLAHGTGKRGKVPSGGLEWVKAGGGTWHEGASASDELLRVFRLSLALPPTPENSSLESECIAPLEVEEDGPVRVVLGRFGGARSRIRSAPSDINFFHVRLEDGQRWRYVAPAGHKVTWLSVDRGGLHLQEGECVYWEQFAMFGDSAGVIEMQAEGATSFVLGSAARRPGLLVADEYVLPAGREASMACDLESAQGSARRRAPRRT